MEKCVCGPISGTQDLHFDSKGYLMSITVDPAATN
jgi:hypothetical protein